MKPRAPWSASVGFTPWRVSVVEHPKTGVLYLRWRESATNGARNWRHKSLGVRIVDVAGPALKKIQREALEAAEAQYDLLSGKVSPKSTSQLRVADTWTIIAAKDGLYPVSTPRALEVKRALAFVVATLGPGITWNRIDRASVRMLGRTRVDQLRAAGHVGFRGAEGAVQCILTVAAWLRDEQRIRSDACTVPLKWREDIRSYWSKASGLTEHEPRRERHSIADMRALLTVAPQIDPRFALLISLGAELRLGQVARCRRSHLDAVHKTLTVPGSGKKKGVIIELTAGQWSAWEHAIGDDGYLSRLEGALPDYPLFPRGQMPGGRTRGGIATVTRHGSALPIGRSVIRSWFMEAERQAKIPHVDGRGAYGLRRVGVDGAKEAGITREGLMAYGGWVDTQVPDAIYAETQKTYARKEAAAVRSKVRGEQE